MATLNDFLLLPPPTQGARPDIDPFFMPPDGLIEAKNILNLDGALVPRPAHTALDWATAWVWVLGGGATDAIMGVGQRRGGTMRATGYERILSSWDGRTWTEDDVDSPTATVPIVKVFWNRYHGHWMAIGQDFYVYRCLNDQAGTQWEKVGKCIGSVSATTWVYDCDHDVDLGHVMVLAHDETAGLWLQAFCTNPIGAGPLTWANVQQSDAVIKRCCRFGDGYFMAGCDNGVVLRAPSATMGVGAWADVGPHTHRLGYQKCAYSRSGVWLFAGRTDNGSGADVHVQRAIGNGAQWGGAMTFAAINTNVSGLAWRDGGNWMLVFENGVCYVTQNDGTDWTRVGDVHSGGPAPALQSELIATAEGGHFAIAAQQQGLKLHPFNEAPSAITQLDTDQESDAIVIATARGWLYVDQGTGDLEDITPVFDPLTGTSIAPTVFRTFEKGGQTWLLGVNGVDRPMAWDGNPAHPFRRFEGSAPVARCIASAANRVLLGNLLTGNTRSPVAIDVSAFNNFDDGWDQVQVSLLGDTPGPLVSLNEISALQVVAFKTDAIYHVIAQDQFYGVAAPFRFEAAAIGVPGPASPRAIERLPDGTMVYLGVDGGLYVYDGVRPQDVGRHVREQIQPQYDENLLGEVWVSFDTKRKLLWCWYPSVTTGRNAGIVMSTDRGWPWPMWPVSLPAGWKAAAGGPLFLRTDLTIGDLTEAIGELITPIGSWSSRDWQMVLGLEEGRYLQQKWLDDGDYTDDDAPIITMFRPGWVDAGDASLWKTLNEVQHLVDFKDGQTFAITHYGSDYSEPETAVGPLTLNSASAQRKTSPRQTARRFSTQYEASITRKFTWRGAMAFLAPRGRR